jgi:hypothetical protein
MDRKCARAVPRIANGLQPITQQPHANDIFDGTWVKVRQSARRPRFRMATFASPSAAANVTLAAFRWHWLVLHGFPHKNRTQRV